MPDTSEQHAKPFSAYLLATNGGRTHADLSDKLRDLVEAVLRTGKAGTITLTIKVDADNVDNRRLVVTEAVTTKLPQSNPKKSVFWAADDGNLVRTDPSQLQFGDIRDAAATIERKAQ